MAMWLSQQKWTNVSWHSQECTYQIVSTKNKPQDTNSDGQNHDSPEESIIGSKAHIYFVIHPVQISSTRRQWDFLWPIIRDSCSFHVKNQWKQT